MSGCVSVKKKYYTRNNNRCIEEKNDLLEIPEGSEKKETAVPVNVEIVQNCMDMKQYDYGLADNLRFRTNFINANAPSGKITINKISYDYNFIGTLDENVNGTFNKTPMTWYTAPAIETCVNIFQNNDKLSELEKKKMYYFYFADIFTGCLECEKGIKEKYIDCHISMAEMQLCVCGLNVEIEGCIGETPFTAILVGSEPDEEHQEIKLNFSQPLPLAHLGFKDNGMSLNGNIVLPSDKKIRLNSEISGCVKINNIIPQEEEFKSITLEKDLDFIDAVKNSEILATDGIFTEQKNPDYRPAEFLAKMNLTCSFNAHIIATAFEKLGLVINENANIRCIESPAHIKCPEPSTCEDRLFDNVCNN